MSSSEQRDGSLRSDRRQLVRFLVVGFSNFAISFTVFHFAFRHGLAEWLLSAAPMLEAAVRDGVRRFGAESINGALANAVAYACGTVNSFIWNRRWTFRVADRARRRFGRFLALNLAGLGLSSLAVFIMVDVLRVPYWIAWLGVGLGVTVMNYVCNKYWVFAGTASDSNR